jgi:hypothetical protein
MDQHPAPGIDPDYDAFVEAKTGDTPHPGHQGHMVDPVDVRVVAPVRVEEFRARSLTSDQVPIGTSATRVFNALRTRDRLTLAARGGDVFLGASGVTTGTGYLLKQDTSVCIESTAAVYAVAAAAGVATVHVLAEIREG